MNRPEYLQDTDVVSARFQASDFICMLKCIPYFVHYVHTWCFAFYNTEERCIWCLGTIPWLGAHWYNIEKVLHSQSGRQCYSVAKWVKYMFDVSMNSIPGYVYVCHRSFTLGRLAHMGLCDFLYLFAHLYICCWVFRILTWMALLICFSNLWCKKLGAAE